MGELEIGKQHYEIPVASRDVAKKPAKCKVIYRSETECTNICKHETSGQKRKVQLPLSSKSFPTQATRLPPFTQSQSLEVSGAEVMCKTSCWRSSKKPQAPRLQRKKHKSNEMGHISFFSKSDPKKTWCFFSYEVSVHICWDGFKVVQKQVRTSVSSSLQIQQQKSTFLSFPFAKH